MLERLSPWLPQRSPAPWWPTKHRYLVLAGNHSPTLDREGYAYEQTARAAAREHAERSSAETWSVLDTHTGEYVMSYMQVPERYIAVEPVGGKEIIEALSLGAVLGAVQHKFSLAPAEAMRQGLVTIGRFESYMRDKKEAIREAKTLARASGRRVAYYHDTSANWTVFTVFTPEEI